MPCPVRRSFITGSYAYGTPTEKSDLDLVILIDSDTTFSRLFSMFHVADDPRKLEKASDYRNLPGLSPIRIPTLKQTLNIIPCVDPKLFDIWYKGTRELIARKPVTRDEAVEHFTKMREAYFESIA